MKIAAGESHALALTADGKVYAWGGGEKGQLGNGYNEDSNYPVLVRWKLRLLMRFLNF